MKITMEQDRITVMLDKRVTAKLRKIQAKQIQATVKAVSFSKVLNDVLRKRFNI